MMRPADSGSSCVRHTKESELHKNFSRKETLTTIDSSELADLDQPVRLSEVSQQNAFWRKPAPAAVVGDKSWITWSSHLIKRTSSKPLHAVCKTKNSPLAWGVNLTELPPQASKLLELHTSFCSSGNKKRFQLFEEWEQAIADWLTQSNSPPQSLGKALETLAIAHTLPRLAAHSQETFWWEVVDAIWGIVQIADQWQCDSSMPPELALPQQILAGELPLTLAYVLPEMKPLFKLRTTSHEILSEGLLELTNGDGLLQGSYLNFLRPFVACWTRCCVLGKSFKKGAWTQKADKQYRALTTHALALSSPEGTSILGEPHALPWTPDFLSTMLHLTSDLADISAARQLFKKKITSTLKGREVNTVPEHSDNCDWAGLAYMRTEWERTAPLVAVDYSSPNLRFEVWANAKKLFGGVWNSETTLNGKRLAPQGSWEEVCWFSDEDVDYVELVIDLADGARLERQILLAREELFLLLADNVIDTAGGKICHRYRLPMDEGIEFLPEQETREGFLVAGKPIARVLPLALPEWRLDPRVGQLIDSEGRLQLEQERDGKNISCPILIDLKKSRAGKPCTWRQLTVAQSLEIQPHDVAVGYRAQCGKQQWLYYRSLAESANRTVLGQNLSLECLVARFLAPEGEIDELLEIE